jgi:hypothetical protein
MNRTIKDATVKVFHYEDLESLKAHVLAFVTAYNFAKHSGRKESRRFPVTGSAGFKGRCWGWTGEEEASDALSSSAFRRRPALTRVRSRGRQQKSFDNLLQLS